MVYFPDAKVVMVSDQITNATPIVDFANGGSAVEWSQILDGVLKLDFESAIPGRGEPKTPASGPRGPVTTPPMSSASTETVGAAVCLAPTVPNVTATSTATTTAVMRRDGTNALIWSLRGFDGV